MGATKGFRCVYHGTSLLLEDQIREEGMATDTVFVTGERSLAELFVGRAVGFAVANGLDSSREGLLVTLEVEASRLRLDPDGWLTSLAQGVSLFINGPVGPESIVGFERVPVNGPDLVKGVADARQWMGWPGVLPAGQRPVTPVSGEPPPRRLTDGGGWHQRYRERRERKGLEPWVVRRRRLERSRAESQARSEALRRRREAWVAEQEGEWKGGGDPLRTTRLAQAVPHPHYLLLVAHTAPESRIHGAAHALEVAAAGVRLIEAGAAADPSVVLAFAILHDSQRQSEGHDPEHGARAADLAEQLAGDAHHLNDSQLELLCEALVEHDRGGISSDPTIGTCWDADRLTLRRLGIAPRARLLSTAAGRELAAAPIREPEDPSWDWVFSHLAGAP